MCKFYPDNFSSYEEYVKYLKEKGFAVDAPTKTPKPFYDKKFHQWCITFEPEDGGYAAVWGDTEEECIERYQELQ